MESLIVSNKPIIELDNGTQELDITEKSIHYKDDSIEILDRFTVASDQVARPDLLSYPYYRTTDEWDAVCVFNFIDNPFSIDEGDMVFVPDLKYFENQMYQKEEHDEELYEKIRNQYYDSSKKATNSSLNDYSSRVKNKIRERSYTPNIKRENDTTLKLTDKGDVVI